MNYNRIQIVVTVPESHLDAVLQAMGDAGGGVIGNYTHCAFVNPGIGRFRPNQAANPAVGEREQVNEVVEHRVETFCERDRVGAVLKALRTAHPYEEPVIYLFPILLEEEF